jgi:uncharacterized protein YndB with AHSA1/START domain
MFTLQQQIDAPPADVARAFTEPEPFAAWFVAEGFTTPADRVAIDARPGGQISAVFVGEAEVPFTLHVVDIDLPRSIALHFDEPAEDITVQLTEHQSGGTQLDYRSVGLTADQEKSIKPGVATMLGHMASYFSS